MKGTQIVAGNFAEAGFVIVSAPEAQALIRQIRDSFETRFMTRFNDDPVRNRSIIKLLTEDAQVKRFFCSAQLVHSLHEFLGLAEPVQTGPIVSHYTASNATGNNYGLPYHQDWPSMGTSSKGVIAWTSISDLGADGPGLRIVPGSHRKGLWPGKQTDSGYMLDQQDIGGYVDVEIEAGHILFMSPFLVHRTRTSSAPTWKLSLSCRFDDFACETWARRNFISAYRTQVDRQVYLT